MSEESLRRLLARLASDGEFAERLRADPAGALEGSGLSATERIALVTNDEDGLRRLAGNDTAEFGFVAVDFQTKLCNVQLVPTLGCQAPNPTCILTAPVSWYPNRC